MNTSLNGIVQALRMEYHSEISGSRWNWNELIQPLKGASNKDKDESDQLLALRSKFDTFKKTVSQSTPTQSSSKTNRNTISSSTPRTNLTKTQSMAQEKIL